MVDVSERLVWARTVAGLSQRRLGLLAGLSTRHVCSFEDRKLLGHMRVDTADGLARVLGTSVSWIAYGDGRPPTEAEILAAVAAAERVLAAALESSRAAAEAASAARAAHRLQLKRALNAGLAKSGARRRRAS